MRVSVHAPLPVQATSNWRFVDRDFAVTQSLAVPHCRAESAHVSTGKRPCQQQPPLDPRLSFSPSLFAAAPAGGSVMAVAAGAASFALVRASVAVPGRYTTFALGPSGSPPSRALHVLIAAS